MNEHRAITQTQHQLSITRRCELLAVAHSTSYYRPKDELGDRGRLVNRNRVQRLWRSIRSVALLGQGKAIRSIRTCSEHLTSIGPTRSGCRGLLSPDGERIHVSGGHHGLVLVPGVGVARIEHA